MDDLLLMGRNKDARDSEPDEKEESETGSIRGRAVTVWKISQHQFAILDSAARDPWRRRLMIWLREHTEPARSMSDEELYRLVVRQEPRASEYGVLTEQEFAKWCFLAVLTGERFDQSPDIQQFLKDPLQGAPGKKMRTLMQSFAYAMNQQEQGRR